jgi:hypothetical protein
MPVRLRDRVSLALIVLAVLVGGCGGVLKTQYEYEEELYLSLDGSATLNVNASLAALVALRGADLNVDPRARLDRSRVRSLFEGPSVRIIRFSTSRRNTRRFVHVSLDVNDVRQLQRLAPFAWSSYRFDRLDDVYEFRQVVGEPTGVPPRDVGWTGRELVAFRMHLPSRISYHNAPARAVERGNILSWEQPLVERLSGTPLELQVQMETQSILYRTLLLFGSTIVAAAITFGLVVWWMARRGRDAEMAESRS